MYTYTIIINLILNLCLLAIFLSVAISFLEDKPNRNTKKESTSWVETGSMTIFFIIYYLVIRNRIGYLPINQPILFLISSSIGTLIIILGTYVNVKGRSELGKNWSNQIKIYQDHTLLSKGMYAWVRHPLYASLIWMFFAGSMIFTNYLAFLLNLIIFIPMMYFRAKQEEKLLISTFPEYSKYQQETPMFIPKIIKPKKNAL